MFWTWQNNYEIMSGDTLTKYPVYYITRHQTDYWNNVQVVDAESSDTEVLPLAGFGEDNKLVLQLVNLKNKPVVVTLEDIPHTEAQIVTSTENKLWDKKEVNLSGGAITLDAQSVNTLVF